MPVKDSAGKALKKAFRQEGLFEGIEPQFAKVSLLMNDTRMRIFLHLLDNPCHHLRGISRDLGLSAPTISWHMKKLVHSGYVEASGSGSKNVFWVTGTVLHEDVQRFTAMNDSKLLAVLKFAAGSPDGFRERDLVKAGNDDQQLVNVRLKKMVDLDLLAREGRGINTKFFLSERVRDMKMRYDNRMEHTCSSLMSLLGADGLRPKQVRKRGTKLTVELTLPGGKEVVSMSCNPLKPFLRRVK